MYVALRVCVCVNACVHSYVINAPIRMFICVHIREWETCAHVVRVICALVCVCVCLSLDAYECILMLPSSAALLCKKVNETGRMKEEQ